MPSFRYRNVKKEFVEIANTADITFRLNNHAFTFANKLEYAIYGKENLMSGGYIYAEYRNIQNKKIAIEPFAQMHWQEIRGLDRKYAGGAYLRWRIFVKPDIGIYAGLGALYEYEKWNYSGVADSTFIPPGAKAIEAQQFRGASYLSFKKEFGEMFDLDLSMYYQPTLGVEPVSHRLASSTELTYNISQYFGFTILYQTIYDSKPVVPIDKLYHDVNLGITISF
ncbi:MAG: DUF481 domain-containing protein [Prolixibacteraceae bacterium]|nr:DUF481 domain-containing protein [Prolixibacteraceae bacterium]